MTATITVLAEVFAKGVRLAVATYFLLRKRA